MLKQRQEALFIFIIASLNTQTYFFKQEMISNKTSNEFINILVMIIKIAIFVSKFMLSLI
ncbi:hypothetical protein MSHRCOH1_02000 [Candidatus Ornithobacterium hominis]|nr:hypothetical protein MSHRCOH1_02000 [Candidatus Ornithobacterium hominis]